LIDSNFSLALFRNIATSSFNTESNKKRNIIGLLTPHPFRSYNTAALVSQSTEKKALENGKGGGHYTCVIGAREDGKKHTEPEF
jgi:hypothetical protein